MKSVTKVDIPAPTSEKHRVEEPTTLQNLVDTSVGWVCKRPISPPSLSSKDGSQSSKAGKGSSSSSLANLDLLLNPSGPKRTAADDEPEDSSDEGKPLGAEGDNKAKVRSGASPPSKQEKKRPCKNQRERYRKLVCKLEEQVRADPFGFEFTQIQLPPSVAGDTRLRAKLQRRLELLAENTRAEEGLPSSSTTTNKLELPAENGRAGGGLPSSSTAPNFTVGAPSLPTQGQPIGSSMLSTMVNYAPSASSCGPTIPLWIGVVKLSL
mmetsp:Transcript_107290/g.313727  ORF Transcript_107290/g.313727 Transcript_107290/m.313727 type:complete len:266 (-) Transcript_107290:284-1081(-)